MGKKLLGVTLALVGVTGFGSASLADCGEVTITEMNWASSAVVTSVSKFLMEQGYGCTVTVVPSSTVPALASVSETGKPDIVTELWVNGAPAYQGMQDAGTIETIADVLSDGGVEGWWIPDYIANAHPELTTVEGILANPELLGGRFHQCPEGWGCKRINASLLAAHGLEAAGYEIFEHGSGETLATSIASAYANNEPWLGYYWAPTSVLGKYPMVAVDLGGFDADAHTCNADPECEAVGKSSYPIAPVKTVVTTGFADKEPDIAALMANLAFTNQQMGDVLAWQEANAASADEAAVYFLTTQKGVWGAWLNDAAREKLAALLQ